MVLSKLGKIGNKKTVMIQCHATQPQLYMKHYSKSQEDAGKTQWPKLPLHSASRARDCMRIFWYQIA